MQLTGLYEGFDDKKVLLILPDADRNTVSMGHQLRPRFVTSQGQRFDNLCAVLKKMIDSTQPKGNKHGKKSNTTG